MIPNKVYDILKWVAIIAIPAIVTFLSVVLTVCGVSAETVNAIVTIGTALATLIGTLIGVSTKAYNDDKESDADE